MGHDQPVHGDDALHPVRRLRRERISLPGPPRSRWAPPAPEASAPIPAPEAIRPRARHPHLGLLLGVVAALAGSATWSVIALHGEPRPAIPSTANGSLTRLPPQGYTVPTQAPAGAIGDLRMFSQSTGWAQRVADGAIVHTTHGVLSWTLASPPTRTEIVAVTFLDADSARALTAPGGPPGPTALQSWATDDGGATWSAGGSFSVRGFAAGLAGGLDFVDPEHGWYSQIESGPGIAGTALFRTVDSGAHWSQVAATGPPGSPGPGGTGVIPPGCTDLTAAFISTTIGWITGTCATGPPPFYRSDDGGVTWADQALALPTGSPYSQTSFPPSFSSAEAGTMVTEQVGVGDAAIATSIYATSDGGRTWALRYAGAGTPLGSDFLGPQHGWLVLASAYPDSADPDLYSSSDGGSSWSAVNAFPYAGMSLDFLTTELGWADPDLSQLAGDPTYLLQTGDGGRTWAALRPQPAPS